MYIHKKEVDFLEHQRTNASKTTGLQMGAKSKKSIQQPADRQKCAFTSLVLDKQKKSRSITASTDGE
jgi:hypothetical protein